MARGRLNVRPGPGGTVSAIMADLQTIWGQTLETQLNIPVKDLMVRLLFLPHFCLVLHFLSLTAYFNSGIYYFH